MWQEVFQMGDKSPKDKDKKNKKAKKTVTPSSSTTPVSKTK
jgi:hypothetical protein